MADLTTTAAVKGFAGIGGSGDDVMIGEVVSAVSAIIHRIVGHDFESTPVSAEKHSGAASGAIRLDKPAASITTVVEGSATLSASDYELEGEDLLWRLANGLTYTWPVGVRNVAVTYVPTSTVPDDLELAARMACAFIVKQSNTDAGAARLGLSAQANADTGSADYFAQALAQLPMVRETLASRRRI